MSIAMQRYCSMLVPVGNTKFVRPCVKAHMHIPNANATQALSVHHHSQIDGFT